MLERHGLQRESERMPAHVLRPGRSPRLRRQWRARGLRMPGRQGPERGEMYSHQRMRMRDRRR